MVYKNNVVTAVKVNGKILRESGDQVTLPFGSEYSVLIKNLNAVRMQVKISIDGKDATEGTWLVIGPNSSLELERFIKDGNLEVGNKFKFIERTKDIEDHRGIEIDDGLIRVEAKKEFIAPIAPTIVHKYTYNHHYDDYFWPYKYPYITYTNPNNILRISQSITGSAGSASFNCSVQPQGMFKSETNENGITVPGNESHQQFYTTNGFATEATSEVVVLRLRGIVAGTKATQPVTVNTKLKCVTCGKSNKSIHQFCTKCGTALKVI
jgi:hypothetical protein